MWSARKTEEQLLASLERGRSRHAMVGKSRVDDLARRLRETRTWCSQNVDAGAPKACLRPQRVAPGPLPRDRWAAVDDFDVYNAPPHGTWVGYFEERSRDSSYGTYLLAWVPLPLMPHADAGIRVNPEECIAWWQDAKVQLREIVRLIDHRLAG